MTQMNVVQCRDCRHWGNGFPMNQYDAEWVRKTPCTDVADSCRQVTRVCGVLRREVDIEVSSGGWGGGGVVDSVETPCNFFCPFGEQRV